MILRKVQKKPNGKSGGLMARINSTNQLFQLSDSLLIWLLADFDELLAGTECKACTSKQAMYRLSSASFWG